jgi:hypothetical protein
MEIFDDTNYIQSPLAKVVDTGKGTSVVVLEDWNVEDVQAGYTEEEVKMLIEILQESLSLMAKYNKTNEKLPLFEQGEEVNVQQETPTQSL